MGCVSQDSYPRKSLLREPGKLGSKHTLKFSKGIQKCEPHMRGPCAPQFGARSHEETMHQERCARKAAWDVSKNMYKPKNSDEATFFSPIEARVMPWPTSKRPEERECVVDSGASMHMISKKESSSEEMDTLRRFTTNGEVHTHDEAQVFVHGLNLFVTERLLVETPAVLPLGKLCEDRGYSHEWVSGQKPRLTQEVKTIFCKTDNFVPLVFPGVHQFWKQFVLYIATKTTHGCRAESHESTRTRVESSEPKKHEDHITGKGFTSMSHYNLVHKFPLRPQVMKIPDA